MDQFSITRQIGNSEVKIVPHVLPKHFIKVAAFLVDVECFPAYKYGEKRLMKEVCSILSEGNNVTPEISTFYVVNDIRTEGSFFYVNKVCFQAVVSN